MTTQYLLLEDVEGLGDSGDVVTNVKPGFVRNFLLPRKMIVVADKKTLRLREKLRKERDEKRILDRQESQKIAQRLADFTLTEIVKVDHEGHMYGSVSSADIVDLLLKHAAVTLEKKNVLLKHPIKTTGSHTIELKLKEGVNCSFQLHVLSEEAQKRAAEEAKKVESQAVEE